MRTYLPHLVVSTFLVILSISVQAQSELSADWLAVQQADDGGVYALEDVAGPFQSTYEARTVLNFANQLDGLDLQALNSFLADTTVDSTEYIAGRLISGITEHEGLSLSDKLLERRNSNGGFGDKPGYGSTPYDTYWALLALEISGNASSQVRGQAIGYLLNNQLNNGGWKYTTGNSVYLTSRIVQLFALYRTQYLEVPASINRAQTYLMSRVEGQEPFESFFQQCSALSGLSTASSEGNFDELVAIIESAKSSQGHWNEDVYTTALCLRAQLQFEAYENGEIEGVSSIFGRVVQSGSSQPLTNVRVVATIDGVAREASTDGSGLFRIGLLESGDLNVLISKSGYQATIRYLNLDGGEVDLGDIALQIDENSASVQGVVVDSQTGSPIAGAQIEVAGVSTLSDQLGKFFIPSLPEGEQDFTATAAGYYPSEGQLDISLDYIIDAYVQLAAIGEVLDDSPADLSGRVIDGETGQPIAASVLVEGIGIFNASSDGNFTIVNLPRGNYQLSLSNPEYQTSNYSVSFPAGASGGLGDLLIYPAVEEEPEATTLTLNVKVLDAISSDPIDGANVVLDVGVSGISDPQGSVKLEGISQLSFNISVTATDYLTSEGTVEFGGYGEGSIQVYLTPDVEPEPGLEFSSLIGRVTDEAGQSISEASVSIAGGLSVQTDQMGDYSIEEIDQLAFEVVVSKAGYEITTVPISIEQHGDYALDVILEDIDVANLWSVAYIEAPQQAFPANTIASISATVQHLSGAAEQVLILGELFNSAGERVANLETQLPGTSGPVGAISFGESESKTVELVLDTELHPPGSYQVVVKVVQEGSISRELPNGVIYASGNQYLSIQATDEIVGNIDFSPPLAQAGTQTPIQLNALIRNVGNRPLSAGNYQLRLEDEQGGFLLERTFSSGELAVNGLATLDFGEWLPDVAGHISVSVVKQNYLDLGQISDIYYIGDLATAEFFLDRNTVPEGDTTLSAVLDVQGVDTTDGSSTDPLYARVLESVAEGGEYVGREAINWNARHRCNGCHVQSQSLVGLASAIGQADVDEAQALYLYNSITTTQRKQGSFNTAFNGWAKGQTLFGVWALGEWPEKVYSHRAKLEGLRYLWGQRTVSGNTIYWSDVHNGAWFSINHESTTAIAAKGIVETIKADELIGDQVTPSLGNLSNAFSGVHPTSPRAMKARDGVIYIAARGGIYIFEPSTGQISPYFVDASGRQFYDMAFDESGVLYAITTNTFVRINNDLTTDEFYLGSFLAEIQFWNGDFYVTQYESNRIWRVSSDFQAVVFASGGLLNGPTGLTVSHDNNLIVANWRGYNLLELDTAGNVSIVADGFLVRPRSVTNAEEPDEYYIGAGTTRDKHSSVQKVWSNGAVENLFLHRFADASVYGLALVDQKLYFSDFPASKIHSLEAIPYDRSLINTLKNNLPNIANYFLANASNNGNQTLYVAFRLVGLGEIRTVTEDPALLASIDTAIGTLEGFLRNRQRPDGGWARFSHWNVSDPLVTAWVGYALDYTNPSPDDPMVRNAITYLLSKQRADGSWDGEYYGSRMGSTSLVMAYMPRALERLGGLEVDIDLEIPANIDLSNPVPSPSSSESLLDGGSRFSWSLEGVTGSGQTIDMDLSVNDMQLNEVRPVADFAQLEFDNSFTDETIVRDIDIPSVAALSSLMLTMSLDKTEYIADEPVDITTTLLNGGPDITDGTVEVSVRTSAGVVIESVSIYEGLDLSTATLLDFSDQWNTSTYPAGAYYVHAEVRDAAGIVQTEITSPFAILPSDGQQSIDVSYGAEIYTLEQSYLPYDQVDIFTRVSNQTVNSSQDPVLAKITVLSPSNETLLSRNVVIPGLGGLELRDIQDIVQLSDSEAGVYSVTVQVFDSSNTELLTQAQSYFVVLDQPLAHLDGLVSVAAATVDIGQSNSCVYTAENRSVSSEISPVLEYQLVNVDTQAVVESETETLVLSAGEQNAKSITYSTNNLEIGGYACVLTATVGEETLTLGFAGFSVELPPVTIDSQLGSKGRVLILMDGPDANGTADNSELQDQLLYISALLDQEGYSYTIVFDADEFEQEFYSGEYQSFLLSSEKVTLSVDVEQALGEATNIGNGLMISGAFNRRNNHIEKALGLVITGNETKADGVLIPQGALGEDWVETVINPDNKLDFERCGSRLLGVYINPKKGTDTPSCYEDEGLDAAATGNSFGLGYSIFVGFDTLDEATVSGGDNAYTAILRHGLSEIQPDEFDQVVGNILPIEFVVEADAVAVDARVTFSLPGFVELIDATPALELLDSEANQLLWTGHLQPFETATITLYVKPLEAVPGSIDALLEIQTEETWYEVADIAHAIYVDPAPDNLTIAIALLQSLVASNPTSDAEAALSSAQSALANRSDADIQSAIDDLFNATDKLAEETDQLAIDARVALGRELLKLLEQEQ